ncbi:hypothetical protein ACFL6M_04605 [Candidatus Eisenbacteria bacterium]|uniref:Outer membrane protein beta-barrel domain-containing protein n=1 Tax=Eiseniibacteriota bacterium TaxID=2212470 RepID=A0ABV6YKK2_UNCEI
MRSLALFAYINLIVVLLPIAAYADEASPSTDGKTRWVGVFRTGYSIAAENGYHPVRSGSWAVSGGLYARVLPWMAIGADGGHQSWSNRIQQYPSPGSSPRALWNIGAAACLCGLGPRDRWRVEPLLVLGMGLYGRRYENGRADMGPGVSVGLGARSFPSATRLGEGRRIGFGLLVRGHQVLMDDYGVAFAGPSHYWTKTLEAVVEVLVAW